MLTSGILITIVILSVRFVCVVGHSWLLLLIIKSLMSLSGSFPFSPLFIHHSITRLLLPLRKPRRRRNPSSSFSSIQPIIDVHDSSTPTSSNCTMNTAITTHPSLDTVRSNLLVGNNSVTRYLSRHVEHIRELKEHDVELKEHVEASLSCTPSILTSKLSIIFVCKADGGNHYACAHFPALAHAHGNLLVCPLLVASSKRLSAALGLKSVFCLGIKVIVICCLFLICGQWFLGLWLFCSQNHSVVWSCTRHFDFLVWMICSFFRHDLIC